jgi:hypothetical protein
LIEGRDASGDDIDITPIRLGNGSICKSLLNLADVEEVLVLELDVLLHLTHLAVLHHVQHVLLPQEPLQEHREGLLHPHLTLILRGNQLAQQRYPEDLPVSVSVILHSLAVVASVLPTQFLHFPPVGRLDEPLDRLLNDVGADIFFVAAVASIG